MRRWNGLAAAALAVLLAAAFAPAPTLKLEEGKLSLTAGGATRSLGDREILSAALSPDGKTVAYVQVMAYSDEEGSTNPTNLYLHDVASGRTLLLLESRETEEPSTNLRFFHGPTFSLDGGYLYVLAGAWVTSDAVHQVNIRTGADRFVIDGNSVAVIRNGRYAGYLLVNRHVYRGEEGAWDPTFVVRPDGKESFMVPGSGEDEAAAAKWLASNGWTAN